MMAAGALARIRDRVLPATPAQEDSLRRVAVRLALQTVALLFVMLLVLEAVMYIKTQQALLSGLETTLKTRAAQPDPSLCTAFHQVCRQGGNGQPFLGSGPPGGNQPQGRGFRPPSSAPFTTGTAVTSTTFNANATSATYINRHLQIVHGDGILGGVTLDASEAQRALSTGIDQCCSVENYRGEDFLVYSSPLWFNGRLVGAVQTSISAHQYESAMQSILSALLLVTILGLLGSGGISIHLTRRSLRPIRAAMQRQRNFVADAAHELRTPLAIMRTVGEVGLGGQSGDSSEATIEQMLAENRHLTRLVDDLSLLARADSNAVAIEHGLVDLASLVTDTVAEIEPLAEAKGIGLSADVQVPLQVQGDILRLRQLLLILLDNALKHTPEEGRAEVRLSAQGGRARLQVLDSGPGISPADLPHVFGRFYRADRARTGEGSGLGLAIGKWIVEAHGGQINAGNVAPHGAVFTVNLPVSRSASG